LWNPYKEYCPNRAFQALNIDEPDDLQRLVGTVVTELGLPNPEPFEASVVLQRLKEADREVVSSNPTFMPAEEVQHRLNSVQLSVRLDQGIGQWFVLLVENESSAKSEIEEMILETKEVTDSRTRHARRPVNYGSSNPKGVYQ
jgi:hypothetical protein